MKINIITHNNQFGLSHDCCILELALKKKFKNLKINFVDFYKYKCEIADINIYLETVSNIFMHRAKYNILIPNQEYYYKSWVNYIPLFDKILVKSEYARNIFETYTNKIEYIGWKSTDRYMHTITKNYNKCLHVCGNSIHKNTQTIIDLWKSEYPELIIVYNSKNHRLSKLKIKKQDNILYLSERQSDEKFNILFNSYGIHLCLSEMEGFGHYINEAKLCKSLVVSLDAPPMNTLINNNLGILVNYNKKTKFKHTLGSKYSIDSVSFHNTITNIMKMTENDKIKLGNNARKNSLESHKNYDNRIYDVFSNIMKFSKTLPKVIDDMLDDNKLPNISIITPTYNRRNMVKLMLLNYNMMNYPIEKREWIIIDDGTEKILDLLPSDTERCKLNIKYFSIENKLSIGEKRNLLVEKSKNDIILCMDDDDLYPPNSAKLRVSALINNKKECVGCSTIGCFHINKLISIINVPPHVLSLEDRLSEASLCFTKDLRKKQKFRQDSNGAEAKEFIYNRNKDFLEIGWENIIVSLLHSKNTSTKITYTDEPNGCHFGWSDKLFLFITNLDSE